MSKQILIALVMFALCGWHSTHSQTWHGLVDKAQALFEARDFDSAIVILKTALPRAQGDDTAVVEVLYLIGSYSIWQGDYDQARSFSQRALDMAEKVRGPVHSDVAAAALNLATACRDQMRYPEAESLLIHAEKIFEISLGLSHEYTTACLNNLAQVYTDQGKYALAEPLYRRALQTRLEASGAEDPSSAVAMWHLAWFCQTQGRYAEAERLLVRALEVFRKSFSSGIAYRWVGCCLRDLGTVYIALGRYDEAEMQTKEAIRVFEQLYGLEHQSLALSLANLAMIYAHKGYSPEVESLYQRALDESILKSRRLCRT